MQEGISLLLQSLCDTSRGFLDFVDECKQYENFKFVLPEFQKHYYEEKAKFLLQAFARELSVKLSETSVTSHHSYSSDLTLY